MRPISLKRQRINREAQPVRDAYKEMFPVCQWCRMVDGMEIHEISRGAGRSASLGVRAAILHLCRPCHDIMEILPVVAQLAIKRVADREGYCRRTVNELRGRAPESITESEVDVWVRRLGIAA